MRMKISILEPSKSLRNLFRSAIDKDDVIDWVEFDDYCEEAQAALKTERFDVVVTAKELKTCSYERILGDIHQSSLNQETPVFLLSSDQSDSFVNIAFRLGVTEVLNKQEIASLQEVLQRIVLFASLGKGARVLLIEDDQSIADYYVAILRSSGFVVTHCTSCNDAIEMTEFYEFELVITDLNLGSGELGQRVIRQLRREAKMGEAEIPIMVLSGSAMQRHKTGLYYLGINDYVVKPVPPRQLTLRAVQLIQKYRAEKEALSLAKACAVNTESID